MFKLLCSSPYDMRHSRSYFLMYQTTSMKQNPFLAMHSKEAKGMDSMFLQLVKQEDRTYWVNHGKKEYQLACNITHDQLANFITIRLDKQVDSTIYLETNIGFQPATCSRGDLDEVVKFMCQQIDLITHVTDLNH